MARIDSFFKLMSEQKASDLHLSTNNAPMLRINGELVRVDFPPLQNDDLKAMVYEIAPEGKIKTFEESADVDFGYEVPGVARYRANFFQQKYGISAVFRLIPSTVLTVEQLGLPPVLKKFPMLKKGLVLITGPTGSGKSTTLAAMMDYANLHRHDHIITVEDPIEFVHPRHNCLISQREIGVHAPSFAAALHSALREDPDVILVGELRDLETMSMAVTAAEMGILVMGTLHTNGAAQTVDRMVNAFPADKQSHVRTMLSTSLRGVVSQQLLKKSDGGGRVAALEILINTPASANLIRQGKLDQIENVMQTGGANGMKTMDSAIQELFDAGTVTGGEAFRKAINKAKFEQFKGQA
jgi:twitching motility protein PilT